MKLAALILSIVLSVGAATQQYQHVVTTQSPMPQQPMPFHEIQADSHGGSHEQPDHQQNGNYQVFAVSRLSRGFGYPTNFSNYEKGYQGA